jgi:hypothetical protein
MPGGFNPAPFHFGASRHQVEEAILKALNQGDGTGLSTEEDAYNYAENLAVARAIAELWSANRRLANQWDALRMTDFLPRWETIYGLHPLPTDSDTARRAAVGVKMALEGQPATRQVVYDLLVQVLGDVFVEIVNGDSATATGAAPGGLTIPGGVTLPDGPWGSGIAYMAVHVEKSGTMTDSEFYTTAGKIYPYLDGLLPAWVDFGWYRNHSGGDPGFILDDPHNLDNEAFG